jgi:hypothetical protein
VRLTFKKETAIAKHTSKLDFSTYILLNKDCSEMAVVSSRVILAKATWLDIAIAEGKATYA